MAGVTSSWKTTVSPMTIAPCGAFVNAAHEPSPANGFRGMPSTFTGTSVRGQAMRTTPSSVVVAFVPAAAAIRSASSLRSSWAEAKQPRPDEGQRHDGAEHVSGPGDHR